MLELPRSIQEILASVGVSQEHVRTFKFGGIIGKVALVALGGFAAVVGVAKFAGGTNQLICVGAILVTVLLVVAGMLRYAEKHPQSATLEGAEILVWQHQQLSVAAKNRIPPEDSPVIANPGGSTPQLSPPEGEDQ